MKLLMIDDHALFRSSFELLLGVLLPPMFSRLHMTQAANVPQALSSVATGNSYDLVFVDWYMPHMSGIEALTRLREALPDARLVVLSGDTSPKLMHQCIEYGASGFIPKDSTANQLTAALSIIMGGGVYLPSYVPSSVCSKSQGLKTLMDKYSALSVRQCEVFAEMARGLPNKIIARQLDITEDTVKQHLSAVYQILKVRNRTEAVYLVSQLNIVL